MIRPMMILIAVALVCTTPAHAEMKPLDDRQLDLVTGGVNQVLNIASAQGVNIPGFVENPIFINTERHVQTIDKPTRITDPIATVGDSNFELTRTHIQNLSNIFGRMPPAPGASAGVRPGGLRTFSQINRIG